MEADDLIAVWLWSRFRPDRPLCSENSRQPSVFREQQEAELKWSGVGVYHQDAQVLEGRNGVGWVITSSVSKDGCTVLPSLAYLMSGWPKMTFAATRLGKWLSQ